MKWALEHVVMPLLVAATPALVDRWLQRRRKQCDSCGVVAPRLQGPELARLGWKADSVTLRILCAGCADAIVEPTPKPRRRRAGRPRSTDIKEGLENSSYPVPKRSA